jgi:hypothetical protein
LAFNVMGATGTCSGACAQEQSIRTRGSQVIRFMIRGFSQI